MRSYEGYFKISRKLLDSDLWLQEPFSKAQAWVDLIGLANYADVQKIDGAKVVTIRRGQVVTSETALAQRWKWDRKKVHAYLSALEELGQISKMGTAKGTVLTLENYDFYQTKGTAQGTAKGQLRVQQRGSSGYTQKERKEGKERKEREREGDARARAYGPNGRLTLTDAEVEELRVLYPVDAERFIEELDEYKGATGREYKSDFDALKRWARQDVRFAGKAKEAGEPRYKSGLEKVMEKIENGTFTF